MHPARRRWLQALAALSAAPGLPAGTARAAAAPGSTVRPGRVLAFPADHGAHLAARTEWWYATGWLGSEAAPTHGFQITFFRSRTGYAADNPSRFAARHLLFAHAAVTEITTRRHAHDQRLQRWNGSTSDIGANDGTAKDGTASASTADGAVQLAGWAMHDDGQGWRVRANLQPSPARTGTAPLPGSALALDLQLARSQPLLLQGSAGFSRKGPLAHQASHYYSEVQLQAAGRVSLGAQTTSGRGRAWMDHEWSDSILAEDAVGWDWIGINLFDGSALTAFVLRRADGSALWAGGSFRAPGQAARAFGPDEVVFKAGTRWRSPATGASYPVLWQVDSPAGRHSVRALVDAQELDSRSSTGTVYWEGLSELLDSQGRRVGLGYLEMTGYVSALKL